MHEWDVELPYLPDRADHHLARIVDEDLEAGALGRGSERVDAQLDFVHGAREARRERADREEGLHQPRAREIPVADERPSVSLGQRELHGGELELARGGQDQVEGGHRGLQLGDDAGGHAWRAAEPPMLMSA